mgnify:CR=1 FL=1
MYVELKNINKVFGDYKASNNVNFGIEKGKLVALLGPSGSGKTTILRMIAGLEHPDSGDIIIDGKVVNDIPASKRGIGFVFQNYALFRYMTVYDNIAFGLRVQKVSKKKIDERVKELIKLIGLEGLDNRFPSQLSGGQRQRVALGRAIVKDQKVFLMDEPLSNLDAKLRVSMRNEISKLHRNLGSTTIYVTHDQVEAMTMADRIVIMKDGIVQQIGKPMELYEYPVNKFVAGFIGSPQMNFYNVKVDGNKISFTDGNSMVLNDEMADKLRNYKEVILGIRGEDIKFDPQNLDIFKENKQRAVIDNTEIMGNENNLYFEFGGSSSVARVSKYEVSDVGEEIEFVFVPHRMHFFDKVTEDAITL